MKHVEDKEAYEKGMKTSSKYKRINKADLMLTKH
jgi:hypothetical protein